ncbi:hypothetical protein [Marinobacter sp. ANT_B65]|uniref:hypothetical protein n=1 Tax=Marinobacter sp. ANT_B65 TaxID=2039467 RepID=UPI000BBECC70|nr:hypothetical protein [Marinobacter sp. ANT_B65]PCM45955.1 hypothetical protein CPA50_08345 [Marinobacter sp. ANT_B65]
MIYTFKVDGLIYELTVSTGNSIYLAITGGASPTYQPEYDPFDWYYIPRVTADIGTTRYPTTVLRTALRRIVHWIGETRPPMFSFSAETEKRRKIYRRVARHLAQRFPYQLAEDGGVLYFYRRKLFKEV